ncbi:MAG: DUF835 domain-containing protein [Theionarchaea archaeon]|nr:DUF835 domain-containing protein [Theionarchaea archaeon]
MPGKVIALILLSCVALLSADTIFEEKEIYDLSDKISTLSALWAGDLEGDRVPEILAGGIIYEEGISKGALVMIKRDEVSTLASIPSLSRTLVMAVCNASEDEGAEIVVGSRGLYVYTKSGRLLREKSTVGDVTALQPVDFDGTGLDEIIYGTSVGDVVYLVDFEAEYQLSVVGEVRFILSGDDDTYYVVTSHSIHYWKADGEQLWSYSEKEEILGAATYDINNDAKKELIYISGPTVYSLSSDGQRKSIKTPPAQPLSFSVAEVTGDGKPDLILTHAVDRVVVYSNLEEEVQSFPYRRESDEIPLLYAADITRDQKTDIIYGGITRVVVFENVVPTIKPLTQGLALLSQGEELYSRREYQNALEKFEAAEKFFIQMKEQELASKCREYITEITEIMEVLSRAEAAFTEGNRLYSEGEYEKAKTQFRAVIEEYTSLAERDRYYATFAEEAEALINECDRMIAEQYFQNGETYLDQMKYDEAIIEFEKARTIYAILGDDKAQTCSERVQSIQDLLQEEEETEQMNLFITVGALFVVVVVFITFLATRKKVSAKLEKGHVYLLLEPQPKKSLQLMKEYGRLGYEGLVISRLPPEQIQKKLKKQKILQLSSAAKEDSIPPDNVVNILLRMKEFMTNKKDNILLLDGLDYIAFQNTFEDALSLIQKLSESATLYKGILLVSVNPKSLEEKEKVLLEEEMELLEP